MARPRAARATTEELTEVTELGLGYLEEFGGGESSVTDGFLKAYNHAKRHGNDEKACILFAMNHGMDEEFSG